MHVRHDTEDNDSTADECEFPRHWVVPGDPEHRLWATGPDELPPPNQEEVPYGGNQEDPSEADNPRVPRKFVQLDVFLCMACYKY